MTSPATRERGEGNLDDFDDAPEMDAELEPWLACGRWDQSVPGGMARECSLIGTEFCDFDCPHSGRSTLRPDPSAAAGDSTSGRG